MGQRTSWQVPGNNITGNCLRKWHGRPAQDAGSLARRSHAGHAHIQARDQDGGGGFRRFILACGPPVLPQLHLQRRGWGKSKRWLLGVRILDRNPNQEPEEAANVARTPLSGMFLDRTLLKDWAHIQTTPRAHLKPGNPLLEEELGNFSKPFL